MVTVLDDAAVTERLAPRTAVAAMSQALVAAYRGELTAPPRVHADGLTFTCGRLGGHWYGYRSYDTYVGGEQLVVVHAEPQGELAGIAVGSTLGEYRTGALGGAAVQALARPDASRLGLIGTGRQAWAQLWAVAAVRELTDVAVFSTTLARRTAFAARAADVLGVPARAVATANDAIADRDIVVLATTSGTPVIDAAQLAPGTAVNAVGPKQVDRAEFGPDLPERAGLLVTDSPDQLASYDPPAVLAGARALHLGAVLAGDHPGRTSPTEITLYQSVGLAGTEPYLLATLLGLPYSTAGPPRGPQQTRACRRPCRGMVAVQRSHHGEGAMP